MAIKAQTRDGKVLKFKIDYNSINPKFKSSEEETDDEKLKVLEKQMLLHPERISEITKYILDNFDMKTYRNTQYTVKSKRLNGFNAMFAVQSVEAAKMYYEEFQKQQENLPENKKLKVATIFSYAPNEEKTVVGEIEEESLVPTSMSTTAKEFLTKVVADYNEYFKTNFTIEGNGFENYYKDLSSRVRNKEVDSSIDNMLLITNDGKKMALDQRLINPLLPDDPNSKVNTCVNNVFSIWDKYRDKKSAQLIFCDMSTPSNEFAIASRFSKRLI